MFCFTFKFYTVSGSVPHPIKHSGCAIAADRRLRISILQKMTNYEK